MEYFIFVVIFAMFVTLSFWVVDDMHIGLIYVYFVFAVIIFIGFKGIEDEYTILYVMVKPIPEFFGSLGFVAIERGYVFALICAILKTFGLSSQSLFVVFAFCSVTLHAYYFKKFTYFYFLAFLIYISHEIIFHEWIPIRSGLASALVLPMLDSLRKNKKLSFFILVIVSALIQYVGILSACLYWARKEIRLRYLFAGLVFAIVFSQMNLFKGGVDFLLSVGLIPGQAALYVNWGAHNYDLGVTHGKTVMQLFLLLLGMGLKWKFKPKFTTIEVLVFNTYYVSTILFILFSDLAIFATRFAGHFYVVEPLFMIYLFRYFKEKRLCAVGISAFSVGIAYINYVYKALLEDYKMFLD